MSRLLPMRLEGVGVSAGGRRLLDGIDLAVPPGLVTLVLGPNGAGKSLLLRACHGLLRPDRGRIVTGLGHGVGRAERALQAMVFQRPVHLRRTALANLTWTLAAKGLGGQHRAATAREALARFGLAHLERSPARRMSGGEQQRLALARAWLMRPQLLILDEPTAALDPAGAKAVEVALQAFVAEGTAVLVSTHDLHQARRLAEKIAFLHAGRLLEAGSADRFFTNPLTQEAAAYLRGELIVAEPATDATPCRPAA